MGWTYIVECADGTYYVGATVDLARRLRQHNAGEGARYTSGRRPVKLVYAAQFPSIGEAYRWERQLHRWKRPRREALIRDNLGTLPILTPASPA
ncbi:MAG: GIY-YIG nuclease family protein [Dehalococcoidia bacterium]|nr:GIY-YIG nuclease family protein [Dehalococcoidia bacterium]MSQ16572.1 GIY-YIG nuclease family protein [Dehalococcoidia bacterium]